MKIVIYQSRDEIIVTTPDDEQTMLEDFFGESDGRDLDDYARMVPFGKTAGIVVTPRSNVSEAVIEDR